MNGEEPGDDPLQSGDGESGDHSVSQSGVGKDTDPEYPAVFETLDDAIFVFDVEHDGDELSFSFRRNNPAHEEITGITVEEFGGASPEEILEESWEDVAEWYHRCVESEETVEFEETIDHETGTVTWHTKLTPLFEDDEVTRIVGVARDVTDRKRHERRETKYRNLFEESRDALMLLDRDGFFDCNEATLSLFEVDTVDAFTDYTPWELSPDTQPDGVDSRTAAEEHIEAAFRDGSTSFEWTHQTTEGTVFDAHVKLSRFELEDGPRLHAIVRDITDRKRRERELERYQTFLEASSDMVTVIDEAGTVRYESPAVEEILGYENEENVGENVFEFVHPSDRDRVQREFAEALEEPGEKHTTEVRFRDSDGEYRWLELRGRIRLDDPAIEGVVINSSDVTERKERQHELEQQHQQIQQFKEAIEQAAHAVYITDTEGNIEYLNSAFEAITGYAEADAMGETPSLLKSGEHDEQLYEELWETILDGRRWQNEMIDQRKDGDQIVLDQTISPLKNEDGEVEKFVAVANDVTERKERERQLRRFEAFIENSPTMVTLLDTDGTVLLDKTGIDVDWRHPPEEFLETNVLEYVHPEDQQLVIATFDDLVENQGEPISIEFRFRGRDETWHWLKTSAVNHEDDPLIEGIIAVSIDVTEQKRRERNLEQYEALVESAGDVLWMFDADFSENLVINDAYEDVLGQPTKALDEEATAFIEAVHPEDRQRLRQGMERLQEGDPIDLELRVNPRENFERWLWVKGNPVFENGALFAFAGFARDITDRHEREQELERHRTYLENTNDMVTLIDPEGTIEYVSPAVERILGFEPAELIGENGFEYVHPDDLTDRLEDIEELSESPGEETVLEYRFQQADGSYRWIESTARNLLDDPDVEGLLLSSRDITDRKEYERGLSTLHETTRRLIDTETKDDVAEIAVEAAQELLEFSLPAVWYPTDDGSALVLVANSAAHQTLLEKAGTPDPTHSSDSWLWDVIESDETVVRSPLPAEDLAADVPIHSAIVLSLGEHGVFTCGAEGEVEFLDREIRIAEILARNVRTALDQLEQREALERQKAFTDDLLDSIEDVVYVLDTTGDFEQWNTALEAVTGYQHDEIASMNAADFFAEEDMESVEAAIEETFETGRTRVQLDFQTADGESIPYEFIAHTFESPDGEPVMAGIGRDRSLHVDYERRLKEERDFFERTIESLPYPFYVLNADDYTIEHTNSLANVSEGVTCYEVTHNREQPCDEGDHPIACPLSDVSKSGEPKSVEHVHHDEDGNERVYQVHAAPIFDADGNAVQMAESNIDITERVKYEQQLEDQRNNLRVLNQVVRHDIRNDMTVVKGRASLLDEHVDPAGQEDLEAVLEATENAIELTKTARDLSETMLSTEEDVEPVGLYRHLTSPIEDARTKFDAAIITVENRIPDVTILGNDLLESVFHNLIQNAVIHNDKDAPMVQISTSVEDETLTVSVADNGPGIPDSQKETIFGKGEKGLDSPGTGIGLYLVRTLVDQYGGDVWVEDNEPEGSVFVVQLPIAE
ncbi:MAG: PAS domain S-box protein [Natronomonas sp.]